MRMALLEVVIIIDNLDNIDNNLDINKDTGGGDHCSRDDDGDHVYRDNDDDMTTLNEDSNQEVNNDDDFVDKLTMTYNSRQLQKKSCQGA